MLDQVSVADDILENWLRERDISEDTIADLAIAVSELVNNAIRHGNKRRHDKKVILSLYKDRDEIEISVTDEGEGFDPDSIPDPTIDANLLKPYGRGIFIARSLVDKIRFIFPPGGGTNIVIVKRI
jgi:serine/threonine-protein kinase RsbW